MTIAKKWIVLYFVLDFILFVCISFGVFKIAYNYGIEQGQFEQMERAIIAVTENISEDRVYNIGTHIIKIAIFSKEANNDTRLYNELASYFSNLVLSGKFEELTDNQTIEE
jgi:hypothetical protein